MRGGRLAEKVAVVTGSTAGIGRASAELFAEEGASVVVNGRRRELGNEVVERIQANGGTARFCYADVSKGDDVKALIQFALDTFGRIDVLMNNAYVGEHGSVTELTEDQWDAAFAILLKAPALASKYAIPAMIKQGGGSIIHVTSGLGLVGASRIAEYGALKGGVINLTRHMAVSHGRSGIRVNAVCPGQTLTEAKVEMLKHHPEQVPLAKLCYPLGRAGTMPEVATAALFLASDESSFVTGHNLVVDGGLTAQVPDYVGNEVDSALRAELTDSR